MTLSFFLTWMNESGVEGKYVTLSFFLTWMNEWMDGYGGEREMISKVWWVFNLIWTILACGDKFVDLIRLVSRIIDLLMLDCI